MQVAPQNGPIHQPQTPDFNLKASNRPVWEVDVKTLLEKGPAWVQAENRRRLEILHAKDLPRRNEVPTYATVDGHEIIDLRAAPGDGDIFKAYERVVAETRDQNSSALMRATDLENPHWPWQTPAFEKDGRVVAAQTADNAHGYYADKSRANLPKTSGKNLEGYGLEGKEVTAIRVSNLGGSILSQEPEAPLHKKSGLNHVFTHGMGVSRFVCTDPETGEGDWTPTQIVPSGKFAISGANNTALQYAQTIFEGLVASAIAQGMTEEEAIAWAASGEAIEEQEQVIGDAIEVSIEDGYVSLFRIRDNAKRFNKSAEALGMPRINVEQFVQTVKAVVEQNLAYIPQENGQLYIRPYMIGTIGGAGAKRAQNYIFGVEVFPFGSYSPEAEEKTPEIPEDADTIVDHSAITAGDRAGQAAEKQKKKIVIEGRLDVSRPVTGSLAKMGGNYVVFMRLKAEANKQRGAEDLLCFDENGDVEEYTSASPFFVRDDGRGGLELVTSRVTHDEIKEGNNGVTRNNLDSITRRTIIKIAEHLGVNVERENINYTQLPNMLAAARAGSAAGLTLVDSMYIMRNADDAQPLQCEFDNSEAIALLNQIKDLLIDARQGRLTGDLAHLNDLWVTKISVRREQLMAA